MEAALFKIDGYWKDDKSEFENALVYEYDECPGYLTEDDIFYFGLNESDIKAAMDETDDNALEFVITNYSKIK